MNILTTLSIRNLKLNKKRTISTIIGIILSVALICAVASMGMSFQATLVENAKNQSGYWHLKLENVSDEEIKEILIACKLENLADKLDIVDDWSRILSLGEQQRIAFVRILLYRPEFVFLDEATSALDEDLEGNLYDMLKIHLPNTKIISIAHRSSLIAKHQAILRLKEKGCWEIHE